MAPCCAISKILRDTCSPTCNCAPHFPSNDTGFEDVHRIFGAMNVRRILNNLASPEQREIAANSLRYAAEARRRDPISGSHGMILHYESFLNNVEQDINSAINELETIVGPDQVPKYVDLPIPDDFLITQASLDSFIERLGNLTIVHRADDASTSAGPSAGPSARPSVGPSTTLSDTQEMPPLPEN